MIVLIDDVKAFCQEKYQNLKYADNPYGRKLRRTKEPLDGSERGE